MKYCYVKVQYKVTCNIENEYLIYSLWKISYLFMTILFSIRLWNANITFQIVYFLLPINMFLVLFLWLKQSVYSQLSYLNTLFKLKFNIPVPIWLSRRPFEMVYISYISYSDNVLKTCVYSISYWLLSKLSYEEEWHLIDLFSNKIFLLYMIRNHLFM